MNHMKSESEIKGRISYFESVNASVHERIKKVEAHDITMSERLGERMDVNYARIRALEWVLRG